MAAYETNSKRTKEDDSSAAQSDGIPAKRPRTEGEGDEFVPLKNFGGFCVSEILSENARSKSVCLRGTFAGHGGRHDGDDAVVLLEKTPFREAGLSDLLSAETSLGLAMNNDIYSVYDCLPTNESGSNGIKTTVIYPATKRHIEKYTDQNVTLIEETWQDYCTITLPYLEKQAFKIQWVYNILEKRAEEVKRIVFEDPDPETGFVLLPDMKWDRKQMENLYLVAIVHRRGLKSLRDLVASHLPLLRNVRDKCREAVLKTYSIPAEQLRMYLHYQPSYYHLHVHVTHLKFEAPGSGVAKAHLLTDVIQNLELVPDYYQRKSLTYVLREKDGLLASYREKRTGDKAAQESS